MATTGTDLFLQVLNERLGLTPPPGAKAAPPRRSNKRATVIVAALAAGVLICSLCSGQTVQGPESAPAQTPPASSPAAPAVEAAPAPSPAPEAAPPSVTAPRAEVSRRAARRSRPERAVPAPTASSPKPAAPSVSYSGVAFEQASWAAKGGALEPGGKPETAADPELAPIESYRLPAKGGRGANMVGDVFGKLILVVALMLGCAAGWKKLQGLPALRVVAGAPVETLEVMESFNLAPQRQLHLVRVSGQRLLIGSTPQSVSLIAELDRPAAAAPASCSPDPAPAAAAPAEEPAEKVEGVEQVLEAEPNRYELIMNRLRESLIPAGGPVEEPAPARLFSLKAREAEPVPVGSRSGLFGQAPEPTAPAASLTTVASSFFSTAATPGLGGQDA